MSSRRPTKTFKAVQPEPPDSPIYKGGYRVGVTVFGKKASTSPAPTAPTPKTFDDKK